MRTIVALAGGLFGGSLWASRAGSSSSSSAAAPTAVPAVHAKVAPLNDKNSPLNPTEFRPFPLINAYDESADTKVLRFALPEGDQLLGMKLASCVVIKFVDSEGKEIIRPYTPISRLDQWGYFEVLVKRYPNSKMGTYLHSLKKGETVQFKGPFEKIKIGRNQWKQIGMIAGGSGITPMFQVAREILNDSKDETKVSLIYASRRKEDVLLGNEINELMELHRRFHPYFVLSQPPSTWMGGIGHVNKEMIRAFMPPPAKASESIIMVCGPPGFMESVSGDKDFTKSPPTQGELKGLLKELGYNQNQVFKF